METHADATQVYMLRVWSGARAPFRAAVRRVDEPDWTPLVTPQALADYLQALDAGALPASCAPPAARASLVIRTLGRFSALRDEIPLQGGRKAQKRCFELLKVLLAFGARDVAERAVADALWPDAEADHARQNLKATLHRLRALVGRAAITVHDGRLSLARASCWVDAWVLEACVDDLLALPERAPGPEFARAANAVLGLYAGPFLGDEDAPWVLVARERLRGRVLRALARAVDALSAAGEVETCIGIIERALEIDPLQERFYLTLMRAHLGQTRYADVLRTYARCARNLRGLLGTTPSPACEALRREALARGDPGA